MRQWDWQYWRGDSVLLSAFTLEFLGLMLDPLKRELKPLSMILAE